MSTHMKINESYAGKTFADGRLVTNKWFDDFLRYYLNSRTLQKHTVLDTQDPIGMVGDYLMEHISIYDSVDTKYMDASNVILDMMLGTDNPKKIWTTPNEHNRWDKWGTVKYKVDYQTVLEGFDDKKHVWTRVEQLYAMFVHRMTGSAASYKENHGYHNTICHRFHTCNTVDEMADVVWECAQNKVTMYSSAACQIPGFPKTHRRNLYGENVNTGSQGALFLKYVGPRFAKDLDAFLTHRESLVEQSKAERLTHNELLEWMTSWNWGQDIKRFWFQYHLLAVDCSDWWPQAVDPKSHTHFGKASSWSLDLIADRVDGTKRINNAQKLVETSSMLESVISEHFGADEVAHKWIESVACLYQKYFVRWVPRSPKWQHLVDTHPEKLDEASAFSCDAPDAFWNAQSVELDL